MTTVAFIRLLFVVMSWFNLEKNFLSLFESDEKIKSNQHVNIIVWINNKTIVLSHYKIIKRNIILLSSINYYRLLSLYNIDVIWKLYKISRKMEIFNTQNNIFFPLVFIFINLFIILFNNYIVIYYCCLIIWYKLLSLLYKQWNEIKIQLISICLLK